MSKFEFEIFPIVEKRGELRGIQVINNQTPFLLSEVGFLKKKFFVKLFCRVFNPRPLCVDGVKIVKEHFISVEQRQN